MIRQSQEFGVKDHMGGIFRGDLRLVYLLVSGGFSIDYGDFTGDYYGLPIYSWVKSVAIDRGTNPAFEIGPLASVTFLGIRLCYRKTSPSVIDDHARVGGPCRKHI